MTSIWRQLGFLLGVAACYAAGMVLSDFLIGPEGLGIAPIWPPAGIAFGAILVGGLRAWPAIAVGYFAGQTLSVVDLPLVFLGFGLVANLLSPVIAFLMVQRLWPGKSLIIDLRNGMPLLLGGLILAALSSLFGTIGAIAASMVEVPDMAPFALEWMLGDLFGVIVCTPAFLSVSRVLRNPSDALRLPGKPRRMEKSIWLAGAFASAFAWIWLSKTTPQYALAITFLPFAFLGWSALRFDHLFTTLAVATVTLTVTVCIQQGIGGFVPPANTLEKSVLLFFLSVMATLPLMVSAAAEQSRYFAEKLKYRANNDSLTGLPNRVSFEDQVQRTVERAREGGAPAAICYLDLDNFKVVNDTCGHGAGDELLKQIAHVLESNVRSNDVLARLGGDEFGVIFNDCDAAQADASARELVRLIDQFRFVWRKNIFAFTASAGVIAFSEHGKSHAEIMSSADAACYDAKEKGGNRVSLFNEDDDTSRPSTAMHWAVRINEALERDRFELYAQAIVPVGGTETVPRHFEVLLRLAAEDGKTLPPGMFIPAAERFNLMPRVDQWVIRNTLEFLRRHPSYLAMTETCAINLSGTSLNDPEFLGQLERLLRRSEIPCSKLCFEITETVAIGELGNATLFIETLKSLGCRFALDDFGSGLSSFGYLRSLDIDYLKIDGVFIRDLVNNPLDSAMVRAINEVGHALNKKTIAEYVENAEIAELLQDLGVDFGQGHAYGKAVPINQYFQDAESGLIHARPDGDSAASR